MSKVPGTDIDLPESLQILLTPVSQLKPDDRNPRRVKDLEPLRNSIRRSGFRVPLVANLRTGLLEAGHQRLKVMLEAGATHLPVVWVDEDDLSGLAYNIGENRTSELVATWDAEMLVDILEGLEEKNFDISELGFTDAFKNALFSSDMDLGLDLPGKGDSSGEGRDGGPAPMSVTVYFYDQEDRDAFASQVAGQGLKFTVSGGEG